MSKEGSPADPESERTAALPADTSAAAPSRPAQIDRYEIQGLLGEGGMGQVFRAHDALLERSVALKVLHAGSPGLLARFLGEARAQARVSHPNVARVYEVGMAEERPFIAMQLVEGRTLAEAAPGLSPVQIAELMRAVAEGVDVANALGLVHRDIKPSNILVETRPDGSLHPYVVDFGLARDIGEEGQTLTGHVVGTPAFMAPEQATGDLASIGPATDVYGLGATLYAALAGRPPFAGSSAVETMVRVVNEEPAPLERVAPGVPADLATIVQKCLEKEPQRRYRSCAEVARDVGRFLAGEPIEARPPSRIYRIVMRARRNRLTVGVAAVALAAMAVLGGFWVRDGLRLRREAEVAREFGGIVAKTGSELRQSYLLPRHDVRPARRRVEERILSIEARMKELGDVARAPGSYAIGRALLDLGRPEPALARLLAAWDAGDRREETAYALALAHARRYEEELAALTTVRNPVLREARKKDARTRYRDPAIVWLSRARRSDPVEKAYGEAVLALLEKRWDAGVARARESFERSEGFYEARLLEARILSVRALEESHGGDAAAARVSLDRAATAAEQAIRIGQSDPAGYETACGIEAQRLSLELYTGGATLDETRAVRACNAVLEVNPDSSRAHFFLGNSLRLAAEARLRSALDPGDLLEKALRASQRSVELDPDDAAGLSLLGSIWQVRGRREASSGGDPRASFANAVKALQHATERHPGFEGAHNSLGVTFWYMAQWETAHGLDPRSSLAAATASLKQATRLLPGYAFAWVNMGGVLNDLGAWETSRGLDPTASLGDATAAFGRALSLAAGMADAWNNSGVTFLYAADHARLTGADPREAVARALAAFEKAEKITPTLLAAEFNKAQALRFEASWKVTKGIDPEPGLGEARRILEALVAAETFSNEALIELGAVHVVAARWADRRGRSPLPELAAARASLERALHSDPNLAHGHRGLADAALVEARWLAAARRAPGPALEAARREIEAAAALDAGHVELTMLRRAMREGP